MDNFSIEKAAHDLAILYVRNNLKTPDEYEEYKENYLNAYHQFHGYLQEKLPSCVKET